MTNDDDATPRASPCPICGKPVASGYRPFCSARCRTIDLHRWLGGVYRVGTDETPQDGNAGEAS